MDRPFEGTLLSNNKRTEFKVSVIRNGFGRQMFIIEDLCFSGKMSVTNNIEDVVDSLRSNGFVVEKGDRIVYCDSDSIWYGILLDDELKFFDFGEVVDINESRLDFLKKR
jgi:hypothetical protein